MHPSEAFMDILQAEVSRASLLFDSPNPLCDLGSTGQSIKKHCSKLTATPVAAALISEHFGHVDIYENVRHTLTT